VIHCRFLLGKAGGALFTVGVVLVLNFFLFRILPGDPARAGVRDPRLTQESQAAIRARFGLDKPVINGIERVNPLRLGSFTVNPLDTQFFIYLRNLLQGNLGISYHRNRPVTELLKERLGNTVLLVGSGQILALVIGIALGAAAAWKSRTAIDYGALVGSLVAWSMPTFWLGMVLLFWGSRWLGLPIGGMITPGASFANPWDAWMDVALHMVLPVLTQTIVYVAEYVLIMRTTMLDVLSEDYILTAKAKGLSTFQILKDHALKNAALPIVTIVALNLGFTVAGAIQVEIVYSWPGLGQAIYESVVRRDYPMLQGVFLLLAVSVVFANLLADLLYSYLDPRVRTA
jgi:peptide/nickel transport system permease protein